MAACNTAFEDCKEGNGYDLGMYYHLNCIVLRLILFRRGRLATCWHVSMGHHFLGETGEGVRIVELYSGFGVLQRVSNGYSS